MKKQYFVPEIENVRLQFPPIMLDVSRDDSKTDDTDSDKSRSFWGSSTFDDDQDSDDNLY